MCGIAGIVGSGAERAADSLRAMSGRIAHRGPDDSGEWFAPDVALAHRRLSIIDLSAAGHQPMVSDCGRYAITYNGEIYNYLELKRDLEAAGETFRTASDTEVLLLAFRRWGEAAFTRFNGMWAVAIWDRETRTLTASRDRFGKKPFYYVLQGDRFAFASEIKALLTLPGVTAEMNPSAIADFAGERISDHLDVGFFKSIHQLPAGHNLTVRDSVVHIAPYWRLTPAPIDAQRTPSTEEIRALLADAVDLRLRADTPVGCLLSGGLDSTLITCLVSNRASAANGTHLFSTVHDPPYEEADGIWAVKKAHPEVIFHPDSPTAEQFWSDLPRVLWHQEQPFADASMVAHFGLMRVARAAGVPVVLSGQGADEVFAGYPGHLWIYLGSRLRTGQIGEFGRFWRDASRNFPVPLRNVLLNAAPAAVATASKHALGGARLKWLNPEFRQLSAGIFHDHGADGVDPLDQALLQSIEVRTLPSFLHYEDRNSMAFGVETRLPYLDYRLAELLFATPPASKLAEGLPKKLLRDAAEGIVPTSVHARTAKVGYPAPLSRWLRGSPDRLRDLALADRNCPAIDYGVWEVALNNFLATGAGLEGVWRGLAIILWHRLFIEGQGAPP